MEEKSVLDKWLEQRKQRERNKEYQQELSGFEIKRDDAIETERLKLKIKRRKIF